MASMTVGLQQELLEINKKSLYGHTSGERQCNKSLAASTFTDEFTPLFNFSGTNFNAYESIGSVNPHSWPCLPTLTLIKTLQHVMLCS